MKPNLGDIIADKYRLDRVLGEGGMSTVYAAANVMTGKPVAIKWLQPEIIKDEEQSQRLLREAQATSSLDHPNVVNVFDVGRHAGALFLVMELLHGESLSELLQRGPHDPYEIVKMMMPVLRGVHAAHRGGVVHRDLKPDNIFICRDPHGDEPREPKVLDFGISKLTDELTPGQELTREGTVFGTPQYMAPEQMRDARVADARSDVYALGVILYRSFSNEYPYDADTLTALAIRIVEGNAQPLHELCPTLDRGLCDVVMRALALDPEQRFESVAALGQALEAYSDGVLFAPGASERESSTQLRLSSVGVRESGTTLRESGVPPARESSPGARDSAPAARDSSPGSRDSSPAARESSPPARDSAPISREKSLPAMRAIAPPPPPPSAIRTGAVRISDNMPSLNGHVSPLAAQLGVPLSTTALDASELIVANDAPVHESRLSIPPPPPPSVNTRPSRALEVVVDEPYTTQRVDRWSRKQSWLIGAALFTIGSIAPASWQLWQKARGANVTSEMRAPRAPAIGKTANVYAVVHPNQVAARDNTAAELEPPTPAAPAELPSAPTPPVSQAELEQRAAAARAPRALPAVGAKSEEGDRRRRRAVSAAATQALNAAPADAPTVVAAPAAEPAAETTPVIQTERNPYRR